VHDMLTNSGCASIIKSVIGLSKDLCINVVAEGIETAEQLSFLRNCNCDEGQGYFISKPKSADELREFMLRKDAGLNSDSDVRSPVSLLQYRKANRNLS
jgi:EAL domain-containing protein (putative c-di-GMP-specific phosphodiesterase class I)